MNTSGPVSTLRGASFRTEVGAMCDSHPKRPATSVIQGETDSFGAEYHNCCDECSADIHKSIEDDRHGRCDWCTCLVDDLRDRRDFEEGMSGRVYRVCGGCVSAEVARCDEDMDDLYDDTWDDPYDDYLDDYYYEDEEGN